MKILAIPTQAPGQFLIPTLAQAISFAAMLLLLLFPESVN